MDGQTKYKEGWSKKEGEISILRVVRLASNSTYEISVKYFVFFGSIMIEFSPKHFLSYFLTFTVTAIFTRLNYPQVWAKLHTKLLITEKY